MAKATSINLLRANQTHYVDTFLKWALTTGRFLIILTESVALAAFVYRFTLDREIIDLGDTLKKNSLIVGLYTQEPRYRNIQERLDFTADILQVPNNKTALMKQLVNVARGKVVFQSLIINQQSVTIELTATSTGALSAFLDGLKEISMIKSVTVDKVENKPTNGIISVGVKAQLVTAAAKEEVKK